MKKDTNQSGSDKIKQMITDRLIEGLTKAIETGECAPWNMPWNSKTGGLPANYKSKKRYRGVNVLVLAMQRYESPTWLSFKQALESAVSQAKGEGREIEERIVKTKRGKKVMFFENDKPFKGGVKHKEKATPVVYWQWLYKDANGKTVKDRKLAVKSIPMLRYYSVFNIAQCEGVKDTWEAPVEANHEPIKEAQSMVEAMPNAPKIEHKEAQAYYRPSTDTVNMPRLGLFDSPESYHSTLFHELVHATGHKTRLDREGITSATANFGSEEYSKEELVAEMGAAMLCGICGLDNAKTEQNTISYLKSWIGKLKDDPSLAIAAGGQAQKAVDYIEGTTWEN